MANKSEEPEYQTVISEEYLPFWRPIEGDQITGICSDVREIESQYGTQDIVDVGDYTVGISAGLRALYKLSGVYVRLTYVGLTLNPESGRYFKKFKVERKA